MLSAPSSDLKVGNDDVDEDDPGAEDEDEESADFFDL